MKAVLGLYISLLLLLGRIPSSPNTPTLRELADQSGLYIGNVLSDSYFFEEHREISAREFNFGVLEFYWSLIRPARHEYDFSDIDEQLAWAESHDMKVMGHALVYGTPVINPDWLLEGTFTRQQYIDIMVEHIETVVSRYAGRVNIWVVTNESHSGNGWYDFFLDKIGPEYVEIAFAAARQANPEAVLLYGDPSNETSDGEFTEHTLQLTSQLRSKNLIDGLALQMHLNPIRVTYERQDIIDTLRAYNLPIYITELDVDLRDVPGTQAERLAFQAEIYGLVMEVALEMKISVISGWGLSDRFSWLEYPSDGEYTSPLADPCLFDDNLQPKPAYQVWHEILTRATTG